MEKFCPEIGGADGGTHESLIQRFLAYKSSKAAVGIGYILRDMRNRRESADYDLDGVTITEDAQYQIRAALRVRDTALGFRQQHEIPVGALTKDDAQAQPAPTVAKSGSSAKGTDAPER